MMTTDNVSIGSLAGLSARESPVKVDQKQTEKEFLDETKSIPVDASN